MTIQISVLAESRRHLHSIMGSVFGRDRKHNPSRWNCGIAAVNISEEDLGKLVNSNLTVFANNPLERYSAGDVVKVYCEFSKPTKVDGHRKCTQKEVIKDLFLERIGAVAYGSEGSYRTRVEALPALVIKEGVVDRNIFVIELTAKVVDEGKFNSAVSCGVGGRGSYGYGLLTVDRVLMLKVA